MLDVMMIDGKKRHKQALSSTTSAAVSFFKLFETMILKCFCLGKEA